MLWVSGVCPAVAFYISKNLCALGTQLVGEGLLPAGVSMLDSLEGSERAADAGQLAVRPDKIVHSVYTHWPPDVSILLLPRNLIKKRKTFRDIKPFNSVMDSTLCPTFI